MPRERLSDPLVKKDTVMGMSGNTQGVMSAPNPARNAPKANSHILPAGVGLAGAPTGAALARAGAGVAGDCETSGVVAAGAGEAATCGPVVSGVAAVAGAG